MRFLKHFMTRLRDRWKNATKDADEVRLIDLISDHITLTTTNKETDEKG